MRKTKSCLIIGLVIVASVSPSQASVIAEDLSTVAPPDKIGGILTTTFTDDPRPVFGNVSSVATPEGGDLEFSEPLSHREVGNGWGPWGHGYTGDVYASFGNDVGITLPEETDAFSLYLAPGLRSTVSFTVEADGQAVTKDIDGSGGASGVGFYENSSAAIDTITIQTSSAGFAIGEFAIARDSSSGGGDDPNPVPAPLPLYLLGIGFFAWLLRLKRYRRD